MKPRAYLYLRSDNTAMICAWCPDKAEAEQYAAEAGQDMSHGICSACAAANFCDTLNSHGRPHRRTESEILDILNGKNPVANSNP